MLLAPLSAAALAVQEKHCAQVTIYQARERMRCALTRRLVRPDRCYQSWILRRSVFKNRPSWRAYCLPADVRLAVGCLRRNKSGVYRAGRAEDSTAALAEGCEDPILCVSLCRAGTASCLAGGGAKLPIADAGASRAFRAKKIKEQDQNQRHQGGPYEEVHEAAVLAAAAGMTPLRWRRGSRRMRCPRMLCCRRNSRHGLTSLDEVDKDPPPQKAIDYSQWLRK